MDECAVHNHDKVRAHSRAQASHNWGARCSLEERKPTASKQASERAGGRASQPICALTYLGRWLDIGLFDEIEFPRIEWQTRRFLDAHHALTHARLLHLER